MAFSDDLEKRRKASAEALRRARDSIDLEDATFEEDTRNTHIHATGSKIVVQNVGAGNAKSSVDLSIPPKKDAPVVVEVLSVLPPWGRVIIALALIAGAAMGGHSLGWW